MKSKTILWIGISVFTLCVAISCIAIGLNIYIRNLVRDGLIDYARISTDTNSDSYKMWVKNYPDENDCVKHTCQYVYYKFWNLTNAVDVQLNGAKPRYDLVGPYTYQDVEDRLVVEPGFENDRVTFLPRQRYTWIPEMSKAGATTDDIIINLNPTYLGAMYQFGGNENALFTTAAGPLLDQLVEILGPVIGFIGYVFPRQQTFSPMYDPSVFAPFGGFSSSQVASVLVSKDPTAECDKQFPIAVNATNCKVQLAPLSFNLGLDLSNGTQQAVAVVTKLVDPSSPVSIASSDFGGSQVFTLSCYIAPLLSTATSLSRSPASANWKALVSSLNADVSGVKIDLQEDDPSDPLAGLIDAFGTAIAEELCNWVVGFDIVNQIEQLAVSMFANADPGVKNISDLVYLEWAQGSVTFGSDLLAPLTNNTAYLSLANWYNSFNGTLPDAATLTVDQTKVLFGPAVLGSTENYLQFLGMCQEDEGAVPATYGLPSAFCGPFLGYIQDNLNDGALPLLIASPSLQFLTSSPAPSSNGDDSSQAVGQIGLFVGRTVDQWLFNCTDPLLGAPCFIQGQDTNGFENAYSRMKTGYDTEDGSSSWIYEEWNNVTSLTGLWAEPEPVFGTDATRFRPLLLDVYDEKTRVDGWRFLPMFVSSVYRSLTMQYENDIDFKGITLWRYRLESHALRRNSRYYQQVDGMGNLTIPNSAPIFVSKFNFFDVDPWVREAIDVVHTPTGKIILDEDLDDTILDIEPYTGICLSGFRRLQLNFQIPEYYTFNDAKGMKRSAVRRIFYPVLQIDDGGTATDADTNVIKDTVYTPLLIATILFWGGIGVGIFGFIAGFFICLASRRKSIKETYTKM
eukprot:ANDGO_05679.mRNA.1 Lysosome membrane protein 2-A